MSSADPLICEHCGMQVTVSRAYVSARQLCAPNAFAAWCGCARVSAADSHFKLPGYGETEAAAIEAWRQNSRNAG